MWLDKQAHPEAERKSGSSSLNGLHCCGQQILSQPWCSSPQAACSIKSAQGLPSPSPMSAHGPCLAFMCTQRVSMQLQCISIHSQVLCRTRRWLDQTQNFKHRHHFDSMPVQAAAYLHPPVATETQVTAAAMSSSAQHHSATVYLPSTLQVLSLAQKSGPSPGQAALLGLVLGLLLELVP